MIATYDLGTTAIKCAVIDENQKVYFSGKVNLKTYEKEGFIEQDPNEWWQAFCTLSSQYDKSSVDSIIFSGQMQDLYFADDKFNPLGNAILYNDQRGKDFVSQVPGYVSKETSVNIDGTIPIAKYYWVKKYRPDIIKKARYLLVSAKDYLILRLTGKNISDTTNMATSGMMNIITKKYINLNGIVEKELLPKILYSDEIVGTILPDITEKLGFKAKTEVFTGSGDAGATTLACGIVSPGEFSINLGTSGWVAAISDSPMNGVFNLPAINRGLYINVIPVLNAASIHNWVSKLAFPNDPKRYDNLHNLLKSDIYTNPNLLCMPYLVGERFPVADEKIRGVYIGLDSATTITDLARSALEGIAFSLKMGLNKHNKKAINITLIGGGASEPVWNQIIADIFDTPVTVFADSEILPSMALSSVILYSKGKIESYSEFISNVLRKQKSQVYYPTSDKVDWYEKLFKIFKKIYPAVKDLH